MIKKKKSVGLVWLFLLIVFLLLSFLAYVDYKENDLGNVNKLKDYITDKGDKIITMEPVVLQYANGVSARVEMVLEVSDIKKKDQELLSSLQGKLNSRLIKKASGLEEVGLHDVEDIYKKEAKLFGEDLGYEVKGFYITEYVTNRN